MKLVNPENLPIGRRYRLISGYWALDLRFRRRQRNCGEDFFPPPFEFLLPFGVGPEVAEAAEFDEVVVEVTMDAVLPLMLLLLLLLLNITWFPIVGEVISVLLKSGNMKQTQ